MYRSSIDDPTGTGELVTARTYPDSVQAELARANLESHGIKAHVIESASFNPLLGNTVGGVRVEVREGDLSRARAILRDRPAEASLDDGEGAGVVRCPRCELAYCFHERARLEGSSGTVAMYFLASPFLAFFKKRWHCHRCGFIWDDAAAGPKQMTALAPDDPIPIFRLRRANPGMGLFLGLMAGVFVTMVASSAQGSPLWAVVGFLVLPGLGFTIGRSLGHDVCSDPGCRAVLPRGADQCPTCHGSIAGRVKTLEEHYSAGADVRRELAALHEKERDEAARKAEKRAAKLARKAGAAG
ncbi:MAG: DUF2007 domain-containing protein [Byssovorax sp.]